MISPKLGILAWARLETEALWALCESSPKRTHLAWARPSFAQNADPSPRRECEHNTSGFPRELVWTSHSCPNEMMRRSKQEPSAWARHSSRTWASLRHSRLGETNSFRREWQYSPLFHACSRNTHSREHTKCKQDSFHTIQNIIQHLKAFNKPKTRRNTLNS